MMRIESSCVSAGESDWTSECELKDQSSDQVEKDSNI